MFTTTSLKKQIPRSITKLSIFFTVLAVMLGALYLMFNDSSASNTQAQSIKDEPQRVGGFVSQISADAVGAEEGGRVVRVVAPKKIHRQNFSFPECAQNDEDAKVGVVQNVSTSLKIDEVSFAKVMTKGTGENVDFALPGGGVAKGSINSSRMKAGEVVSVQGRLFFHSPMSLMRVRSRPLLPLEVIL